MQRKKPRRLTLERLEERAVMATFGVPWQDPGQIRVSFVPDGTAIAAHSSNLESALDGQLGDNQWQGTILAALAAWSRHANFDFGVVLDNGAPLGSAGRAQGDPRFGDIRIGAHEMTPEVLGVTVPPDPGLSGTWSGDVLLNSAFTFDGQPYSLTSVMLHELGHALGIGNSTDANSVMFTTYNTTRTDLAPVDIAAIQALYGVRTGDKFEGSAGNGTLATATPLPLPAGFIGATPLVAFGNLTDGDVDVYSFVFPTGGVGNDDDDDVTLRLQTAGVSLLSPTVQVLDASGTVVVELDSDSMDGDELQLDLNDLDRTQTYYIRVSADDGTFDVGRYGLALRFDDDSGVSDDLIESLLTGPYDGLGADAIAAFFASNGTSLFDTETSRNNTRGRADVLATAAGYTARTFYETISSLNGSADVDFFRIQSPVSGPYGVLTATVWTPDASGFAPQVSVVDRFGRAVAAEILVNGQGTNTIQIRNAQANQIYYLRVANASGAAVPAGNYLLSAGFRAQATQLATFAGRQLANADRSDTYQLYIGQTQLFHFVLSATPTTAAAGASIALSVIDDQGSTVFSLTARSGQTVSGSSVLLKPGAYRVRMELVGNISARTALSYLLKGDRISDPIGTVPSDPTLTPVYTTTTPGQFNYPPPPLPPIPPPNPPPPPQPVVTFDPFIWIYLDPYYGVIVP